MEEIIILPGTFKGTTDFGLRNFYLEKIKIFSGKSGRICLTNTFQTACSWALRNEYAAVVIFVISNNYIDNLPNHLKLTDLDLWKETTFKIRNPPNRGPNLKTKLNEYYAVLNGIDSYDLISGSIVKNVSARSKEEIEPIKYGNYIPLQYSFKDTTLQDLENMLAITIFFKANRDF